MSKRRPSGATSSGDMVASPGGIVRLDDTEMIRELIEREVRVGVDVYDRLVRFSLAFTEYVFYLWDAQREVNDPVIYDSPLSSFVETMTVCLRAS